MTYTKLMLGSHISDFCKFRTDDIVYCALPFYHTAGCMAGLLTVLSAGKQDFERYCVLLFVPRRRDRKRYLGLRKPKVRL